MLLLPGLLVLMLRRGFGGSLFLCTHPCSCLVLTLVSPLVSPLVLVLSFVPSFALVLTIVSPLVALFSLPSLPFPTDLIGHCLKIFPELRVMLLYGICLVERPFSKSLLSLCPSSCCVALCNLRWSLVLLSLSFSLSPSSLVPVPLSRNAS